MILQEIRRKTYAYYISRSKCRQSDKVTQEVIDTLRRGSLFMDELTFDDAVSPGVGGSTMTYGYLQLQTPSTAAGRAINSEYTANEAKKVKKTVDLKSSAVLLRLTE